jgi:predicted RNA-binding protein with RPS1 domain
MLAANYNITIDRATSYGFVLTIKNPDGGLVDITSAEFYADIRDTATKRQVVEFNFLLVGDGQVRLSLTPEETKLMRENISYEYDLFMIRGSQRERLLEGSVTIRNNRTNDV